MKNKSSFGSGKWNADCHDFYDKNCPMNQSKCFLSDADKRATII